ncbi:peptidoglycan DD-metalloendopeptidase family protein [Congregibacter brevis]|uniref:Peptidoglycan DD-metalloendopeptidase family protein n=1 Tax=Congregibacter brevis TaxID=3081201 RepID=A0ABZ0I7B0_9GAMM|nr:peptidoglycan DD-metalloendopeptidase family protein [Congregibacter sp. IMCC45268]
MLRLAVPLCGLFVAALITACADKPLAPIEDRSRGGTSRVEERYTVLRGDTLFSIAFRYGLDFRRLAAANTIVEPYTIFPGQTLRLAEAEPPKPRVVATPVTVAKSSDSKTVTPVPSGQSARKTTPTVNSQPKPKPRPTPTATNTQKPSQAAAKAAPVNIKVSVWRWPAKGKVVRRFDKNLHKGVDISGSRGDAVEATAAGRVVYAGSGIAGYGLMLIVRHNDEFLSAYGHNDALLVDEGDVVRSGQKIAERGSSGTDSVKLHFEIRQQGRPVDPLKLLPAR